MPLNRNAQRGALIGLAVGDALGAAIEFQMPGDFMEVTGFRAGGPHGLRPGEWTDYTSMALALADSIGQVGWDLNDQARRYIAWWKLGQYSVNGRCFDIGFTTRRALARFQETGDAKTSGDPSPQASGNGSVMRLAPVARNMHKNPPCRLVGIPRRSLLRCTMAAAGSLIGRGTPGWEAEPKVHRAWIKSPRNPMLSLSAGSAFDSQNLFAPAVAKQDGRYWLFYSGGPAGPRTGESLVRYQLGLALSQDGIRWEKTGQPLLPLGDRDDFHCTPALLRGPAGDLLKSDGLWHLVYCGNRGDDVEHATSSDGRRWTKDPGNPIFRRAYAPNLVQVGDSLRMYFVHKPQRRPWEIHVATGPDFHSLSPHPANPLLTVSQQWEKGALFYPYVLREGTTWIMFYGSYWKDSPDGRQRTAIGMATSADGLAWQKSLGNPVLTPMLSSPYDSLYTSSQAVIRDGDHYKMYYASRIDMVHKYYAICLATWEGSLVELSPLPVDPPRG